MPTLAPIEQTANGTRPADWHAAAIADIHARFATSARGLSHEIARQRLELHGPNVLPASPPKHPLLRFAAQFDNVLVYFLLVAAAAAWTLGEALDAAVVVAVVLINAIVGFIQEARAENALNAIRGLIAPQASVWRDGERCTIGVGDIVPGDVVMIEAGDRVPADLRLIEAPALVIDEAALTGESFAVHKDVAPVALDAPLAERSCMAYAGTWVLAGRGMGVAVATARRTEIGHISALVADVQDLGTPLLRQMNAFSRQFTWIAIGFAALLFLFAVAVRGFAWQEALLAVVALAVGAVPEGLPAVITITLAIGVRRMAARNAVIRRLPAVETLGSTSVICTDKTGTLTRNEMVARRIVVRAGECRIDGTDYASQGRIEPDLRSSTMPLLSAAVLCNDAHLREADGRWHVEGDPMEGALLALAAKAGVDNVALRKQWPREAEIPFDPRHRLMATSHRTAQGALTVFVKGAPERLFELCSRQAAPAGSEPVDVAFWSAAVAKAAAEGERVLAFARKTVAGATALSLETLGEGLELLGLVGMIDPPRDDARESIAQCQVAGIEVKMITGDHAGTAGAIARQLGIAADPVVVTGAELESLSEADLQALAQRTHVFARTSPEHKLRIVAALQAQGERVAMTGDGVNDAPALKRADVGVAMGRKGTEAAKEAADMVLLDDRFSSIVAAVHEGRTVYDNIRKIVVWTLPADGGEVLIVMAAMLFGLALPLLPTHILWINLVTTAALGLVLAFEPPEPGIMRKPPRAREAPLLSAFLVWRIVLVSVLFTAAGWAVFYGALARGSDVETARTLVVNAIVVLEIFYLFNVRYMHMRSLSLRGALGTPAVLIGIAVTVAAQLAFTYAPFMQALFATRPVAFVDGLLVVGLGVVFMLVLEIEKKLMRGRQPVHEVAKDGCVP